MTRASVALAHKRCFRTSFPPGGQAFPNALLKADRQELPCRCARTGCRCGRSGLLARGSPPPSAFPRLVDLSGVCRTEAPRSQLRDSSGFAPDSLGALPSSYPSPVGERSIGATLTPLARRVRERGGSRDQLGECK